MISFLIGALFGAAFIKFYDESSISWKNGFFLRNDNDNDGDGDDNGDTNNENNNEQTPILRSRKKDYQSTMLGTSSSTNSNSSTRTKPGGHQDYNELIDTTTGITHVNVVSDLVARLWPYLTKAGSVMVRETVEPTFRDTLPGLLATLQFTKLELGTEPLRIDNIIVHKLQQIQTTTTSTATAATVATTSSTADHNNDGQNAKNNNNVNNDNNNYDEYLQFEWDVTWNSKCDIQLATEKLMGGIGPPITFGVKGITFTGRIQFLIKPLSAKALPCMDGIQFGFVNPPTIDLDFTGLANIAAVQLKIGSKTFIDVKGKVRDIVKDVLGQTLVLPNRIYAPIVDTVDYRDIFHPAYQGLARIAVHQGRGFATTNQILAIPKPTTVFTPTSIYIKVRLGAEKFYISDVVKDSCTPTWDPERTYHDFLYCSSRDQIVEIQAWKKNGIDIDIDASGSGDGTSFITDNQIGVGFVTLGQILLQSQGTNGTMEVQLMKPATKIGKNVTMTDQYVTISMEKLNFTTRNLSSIDMILTENENDNDDMSTPHHHQAEKQLPLNKMKSKIDAMKYWKKEDANRVVGLVTILISHATNLPFSNKLYANTFIKVWYGGADRKTRILLGETIVIPESLHPKYEKPISFPLTRLKMMKNYMYVDDKDKNYIFEMYAMSSSKDDTKTARSIGEMYITYNEILQTMDIDGKTFNSSIRDTRRIGRIEDKTMLAFSVSIAGVEKSKKIILSATSAETTVASADPSIELRIEDNNKNNSNSNGNSNEVIVHVDEQISNSSSSNGDDCRDNNNVIRVRIVKAWGFRTEKKKLLHKVDVPDVYCMIKYGSSPAVWRTSTIKDNENPKWDNETHDYILEDQNQVISVDVWDENSSKFSGDDYYGNARASVHNILSNGGSLDLEITQDESFGDKKDGVIKNEVKETKKYMKEEILKVGNNIGIDSGESRGGGGQKYITIECCKL